MTPIAHSKIGIAACAAGVAMFLVYLAAILYYRFAMGSYPETPWVLSPGLNLLVMAALMFVPIPVHVVGFVMGAVSLFFPKRAKLFPLLAIVLNAVFALLSVFPWIYVGWLGLHSGVK